MVPEKDILNKGVLLEYYSTIFSYCQTRLNILIRTSGRPNYFYQCMQSIRKISPTAYIHVTVDNKNDLEYVLRNVSDFEYSIYVINKLCVTKLCDESEKSIGCAEPFIYNYYFNIVRPFLFGWCIIIDDDDIMISAPEYDKSIDKIYIHKTDIGRCVVPSESFGIKPVICDISSLCIVFHSSQMVDWKPFKCGDYTFISELFSKYQCEWKEEYISRVQTGDNFGRRNDIPCRRGISIVIPAYRAQSYIDDCLYSIQMQFKEFDEYEILVGVDGCNHTLSKLLEIKHKYRNLRIFWLPENVGPYIIKNSLVSYSKFPILSFFDADDIMANDYIELNKSFLNNGNFINVCCNNFNHPDLSNIVRTYNPDGIIMLFKDDFLGVNGYMNWPCGADTDLIKRLIRNGLDRYKIDKATMYRRLHQDSLMHREDYGSHTEYRKNLRELIKTRDSLGVIKNDVFYTDNRMMEVK